MTGEAKIRTHGDWESQKEIESKGMQALTKIQDNWLITGFLFSSLSCSYIHSEVSYPFLFPLGKSRASWWIDCCDSCILNTELFFPRFPSARTREMHMVADSWLTKLYSLSLLKKKKKKGNLASSPLWTHFLRRERQFWVCVLIWPIAKEFSLSSIPSSTQAFPRIRRTVAL